MLMSPTWLRRPAGQLLPPPPITTQPPKPIHSGQHSAAERVLQECTRQVMLGHYSTSCDAGYAHICSVLRQNALGL